MSGEPLPDPGAGVGSAETGAGTPRGVGAGFGAGFGAGPAGSVLRRALRGVRWYARELSGEARWDDYVERCRREGTEPMSRRAFERHRDDHREGGTQSRCC